MKNTENKFNEIFITQNYSCQKKIEVIETKINTLIQKIADLSNNIPNESRNSEKIILLEDFHKNAKETLYTQDYRIKKIYKNLHEALIKYDKIIVDSLFYPGVIGKNEIETPLVKLSVLLIIIKIKKLALLNGIKNIKNKII